MCFHFLLQFRGTEMVLELQSILLFKEWTCSSCIINIVAADDLGTRGARVLIYLPQNIPNSASERLTYNGTHLSNGLSISLCIQHNLLLNVSSKSG